MKNRLLAVAVTMLLWNAPAFAVKTLQKVTPAHAKGAGFAVETKKRDDGTIGFTITRHLDKARSFPADSELTVNRSAHLEIRHQGGSLAKTIVAGEQKGDEKNGTVVYWFALSPDCIPYSNFHLNEFDDYKNHNREHLIGGGTMFEFDLAEFATSHLKPKVPLHP